MKPKLVINQAMILAQIRKVLPRPSFPFKSKVKYNRKRDKTYD